MTTFYKLNCYLIHILVCDCGDMFTLVFHHFQVTNYLQEIAPDLCDRVELYNKSVPLFDEFGIEQEINNMLSKR